MADHLESDRFALEYARLGARCEQLERMLSESSDERVRRYAGLFGMMQCVRGINQLVAQESDRDRLLEGSCRILVDSVGQRSAWIALMAEDGSVEYATGAGMVERKPEFITKLLENGLPSCARRALETGKPVAVNDIEIDCPDCLIEEDGEHVSMVISAPMECRGETYGVMTASFGRMVDSSGDLIDLFAELARDIAFGLRKMRLREAHDEAQHRLGERVKEQHCLYDVYRILRKSHNILDVLQLIADRLPSGWHYPDACWARVEVDDQVATSELFKPGQNILKASITANLKPRGEIHVGYIDDRPILDEGPFLKEERHLVDQLAGLIGETIERNEAARELREERDLMSKYLRIAGVVIVALDAEGRVSLINRKGCELLGYPEDEILGKDWFQHFIPAGERDHIRQVFQDIALGEERLEGQNRVWTASGEERLISWKNVVLYDKAGAFAGTISSGEDITERIETEKQLHRAMELLETTGRMLHVGGWEFEVGPGPVDWDEMRDVPVRWSKEVYRLHEVEEAFSPTIESGVAFYPGNAAIQMRDALEKAITESKPFNMTVPFKSSLGRELWVQVRGWTESLPNGGVRIWGTFQDVTKRVRDEEERRKFEAQVQQTQKLESLGVLAGGIAHDFNNLLMGILGNADLALSELSEVSPVRESIHEIVGASRRAADLCRQMLAYSGRGRFEIRPIDVSELVEEMAHMLEVSISKKAVLKYRFAKDLPAVLVDATQIRQIVMNLITNASEAIGDRSGVISITTGAMDCDSAYLSGTYIDEELPSGCYVFIEVSDTGCGMDAETQQKIFDPFYTTKFTGRGLGLAAVLGIVRGHRGAIKVYSEPGRGTTFKVLLPAVEDAADGSPVDGVPLPEWEGEGTVLVVDDEETVRVITKRMLAKIGFEAILAQDGREALDFYREQASSIKVVILDLTMPHMDGEQTFRELRRLDSDARVILASGYNEQEVSQRFAGKGVSGFLQKPFRVEELRRMLQQVTAEPAD